MPDLNALITQGSANIWLLLPSAILLGALHGLEPGHSKTMMAAFIIAVRGTVTQAVLLGLAATVSHTIIVWVIALAGLTFGSHWNSEATEPYLQLVSATLIVSVAVWMIWRTWRDRSHDHHHHHHGDEVRTFETGHGTVSLSIYEDGVPPRWRLQTLSGHGSPARTTHLETLRPDGSRQTFTFAERGDFLESVDEIPEPHQFEATLILGHADHAHRFAVSFHEHAHDHEHGGLDLGSEDGADAHERAHAADIRKRFANRHVTTAQIVMFGLTGGLIPCPASITVLLLCLQLKQFTLGATLVLGFSVGLAITMVSVGAAAALSTRHLSTRWSWFGDVAQRAPYLSSALIICVGLYTGYAGWTGLSGSL